jgi:hypothetical protein
MVAKQNGSNELGCRIKLFMSVIKKEKMTENKEHNNENQNEQNQEQMNKASLEQTSSERPSSDRLPPVLKTLKDTVSDAFFALKKLTSDPGNGQQSAIATLGDVRSFKAGTALSLVFVICSWLIMRKLFFYLDFWEHLKLILCSALPPLSLVITLLIAKSLFKIRGNWQQFTLITGITFFPICIGIIIFAIFGINKIVIILAGLSGFTMAILILNASLLNVLRVSSKQSLILTTTLTVIVVYVGTSLFNYLSL